MDSVYIHTPSSSPEKDSYLAHDKNNSERECFHKNNLPKKFSRFSLEKQAISKAQQEVNTSLDIQIEINKKRDEESPSKPFNESPRYQSGIYLQTPNKRRQIIETQITISPKVGNQLGETYINRKSSIEKSQDGEILEMQGEIDIEEGKISNSNEANGFPSVTSLDGLLESNDEENLEHPNRNITINNNTNNNQNNTNRQQITQASNQTQQNNNEDVIIMNDNNAEDYPEQNLEEIVRVEIAIQNSYFSKIRRLIGLFFGILLASFFVPHITTDDSPRVLFILTYITLSYYFLELFSRVFAPHAHPWQKTEQLYKALDIMTLIIFFALLDMNIFKNFQVTKLAIIAPIVFVFLYYFSSYAPQTIRESEIAFRLLFIIQILFITLKLDGDVSWSWKIVLTLVWFYLGLICLYFILLLIIFVIMCVIAMFGKKVYENLDRKTQLVGHLWHFLYVSFGVIALITLVGVTITIEDNEDYNFLYNCISTARYVSIFLISHGIVFYHRIVEYLRRINNEEEFEIEDYGNPENEKRITMIKIEKNMCHLVKMSSTYFLPLQDSFAVRDKNHLKKLRKNILESKDLKFRRESSRKKIEKTSLTNSKFEFLQGLKQDQEKIEKKLLNLGRQITNHVGFNKKRIEENSHHNASVQPVKKEEGNMTELSVVMMNGRAVCLSEGDQENFYIEKNEINDENENNECYICVDKPSNAVIMNCGHGGVCYDCAIEFVKKKSQCMECRQEVNQVVKINPDPKFTNIIQGYETVKLIFE